MSDAEKPAVVLASGGLDSSVLTHHVARTLGYSPVYALTFDYGQRHRREIECAAWQARAAGCARHEVVDLRFLGDLLQPGTTLVEGGAPVPNLDALSAEQLEQPPTYVPNRNMMLLSIAAAYAEANGVFVAFYGAQAHDEYGYWDCTLEFLARINAVLALNRREPVRIHAPFVNSRKSEVVRLGTELGVNFSHTWTCYRGEETACGACPSCVERRNAFSEARAPDPLPYAAG